MPKPWRKRSVSETEGNDTGTTRSGRTSCEGTAEPRSIRTLVLLVVAALLMPRLGVLGTRRRRMCRGSVGGASGAGTTSRYMLLTMRR